MEIGQGSLIPMGAPSTILGFVQRAEGKHFLGSAAEPEAVPKFLAAFQSHAELFDRAFNPNLAEGLDAAADHADGDGGQKEADDLRGGAQTVLSDPFG